MRSCEHAEQECKACWKDRIKSVGFVGTRLRNSSQFDREREKTNSKELRAYEAAVREGSQPDGTQFWQVEKAKAWSDKLGVPYRGDNISGMLANAGVVEARELSEKEKEVANPKRSG